mmetsp:Transcript_17398/g.39754  ORF Transcript_17398/g.39754 Transcript_17398/m.39754 type:complete len:82 (+) Transcript_17398:234-479(+)
MITKRMAGSVRVYPLRTIDTSTVFTACRSVASADAIAMNISASSSIQIGIGALSVNDASTDASADASTVIWLELQLARRSS